MIKIILIIGETLDCDINSIGITSYPSGVGKVDFHLLLYSQNKISNVLKRHKFLRIIKVAKEPKE